METDFLKALLAELIPIIDGFMSTKGYFARLAWNIVKPILESFFKSKEGAQLIMGQLQAKGMVSPN